MHESGLVVEGNQKRYLLRNSYITLDSVGRGDLFRRYIDAGNGWSNVSGVVGVREIDVPVSKSGLNQD